MRSCDFTLTLPLSSPVGDNPGSPAQDPTVNAPTQVEGAATPAPVVQDPTGTTGVPVEADLSMVKATGQTSTSLTEAQSSARGYNQSVQTLGAETITIETILIDPTDFASMPVEGGAGELLFKSV